MTRKNFFYVYLLFLTGMFVACADDYYYNDKEPDKDVLGDNIYDYLKSDGNFTYYLRIVDGVEDAGSSYAEVLKKTGTKTVFVADDKAFEAFFKNNPYGIRSFEDLTVTQKRSILFANMLDDAYLLEMMSCIPGSGTNARPIQGTAMRRPSAWALLESVKHKTDDELPNNPYWNKYKNKNGVYTIDYGRWTMVHFLPPQMLAQGISGDDFRYLMKTEENPEGIVWNKDDAYIFNVKIVKKDIACKNGYINVLEKLQLPYDNMADYIKKNKETSMFVTFMERFCAPYYSQNNTQAYRNLNPDFQDRIYVNQFFTEGLFEPDENGLPTGSTSVANYLKFDPSQNTTSQTDMGVMFVPTDKALDDYFNKGAGVFLKESYGSWENVPDNVMSLLVSNHMQRSFLQATPMRFNKLEDITGVSLNIKTEDLKYSMICSNGAVYVMNKVYPPVEYSSVQGPVVLNNNTRIMDWAIRKGEFNLYLLSMINTFSFFVPTDDVLNNYVSPVSIGKGIPERWKFNYNKNTVTATTYNLATGDSTGFISNEFILINILSDIIDNHIVVGNIDDGRTYYQTKGGATIKLDRSGGSGVGLKLDGGGNGERNEKVTVTKTYNQENGMTYLTDKIMLTPTKSVYSILQEHSEFSEFYALCRDVKSLKIGDETFGGTVFEDLSVGIGITPNVTFFNTYNYTVYVPTNAAMQQAHDAGRYKTPEEIESLDLEDRGKEMQKLYEFLRYHFQDNSIYIGGETCNDKWYETATINPENKKFRRLWVTNSGSTMTVRSEKGGNPAKVLTGNGLYNLMARDYIFNSKVITSANSISTSSFAVIHQIDAILDFK
ncbi:MAG: fasciclin domain-containing protein [Dysgonamonadaceae bacterium]|nr:fasciclin domain-containing protein [Dysgonamonadaceae bacterium]